MGDPGARYTVKLSTAASDKLKRILHDFPEISDAVMEQLNRFSQQPASLSHPSKTPPHPPGLQVFEFPVLSRDSKHYFWFFFRYGADEQSLWVGEFGYARFAR